MCNARHFLLRTFRSKSECIAQPSMSPKSVVTPRCYANYFCRTLAATTLISLRTVSNRIRNCIGTTTTAIAMAK
jgi:hypothetical protein